MREGRNSEKGLVESALRGAGFAAYCVRPRTRSKGVKRATADGLGAREKKLYTERRLTLEWSVRGPRELSGILRSRLPKRYTWRHVVYDALRD